MEELLPVGTIVAMGEETVEVEIAGYAGKGENGIYDYIGFVYPYGFMGRDRIIMFNRDKVIRVIHEGYKDDEFSSFAKEAVKVINDAREVK